MYFLQYFLLILMSFSNLVFGYVDYLPRDLSPPPQGEFISDPDAILTSKQKSLLNEKIHSIPLPLEIDCLIIQKISSKYLDLYENQDEAARDFAEDVFERWRIGNVKKKNGLLIFLSIIDRKFRIVTGSGAREVISDKDADSIFYDVKNSLQNANYFNAINYALDDLEYYGNPPSTKDRIKVFLWFLFIVSLLVGVCCLIIYCVNQYQDMAKKKREKFESQLEKIKDLQKDKKLNENFFKNICSICLEEFLIAGSPEFNKNMTETFVCGHIFHQECVKNWLNISNICPVCKINDPKKINDDKTIDQEENQGLNADAKQQTDEKAILEIILNIQSKVYPDLYDEYSYNYGNDFFTYELKMKPVVSSYYYENQRRRSSYSSHNYWYVGSSNDYGGGGGFMDGAGGGGGSW